MTEPDVVVKVSELTKSYKNHQALSGVSFQIERGESYALLGPNGAGKSTTIEILEGYRTRSSGSVRVLGIDPEKADLAWKAKLGIVLQQESESDSFTVYEKLSHFASYYKNPLPVEDLIESVGLATKAKAKVKSLSGGQRRRVDVALSLVGRPELLFLDEPTTGFDPKARREFWELILQLKHNGTTIILTTHYLDEVEVLGDRVGVIANGRMITEGTPKTIGGSEARVPILRWVEAGIQKTLRTENPAKKLADLYQEIGEPEQLEIIRPSLEDVYLDLLAQAQEGN